jgi:hypothetical protein
MLACARWEQPLPRPAGGLAGRVPVGLALTRLTHRKLGQILAGTMVAEFWLQVEVVGCPTVCRHCWAQGVPY